jgi:hypothetical protein
VDYANKRYVCQYCGREITDEQRRHGQWVAKYPSRDISGYWVSQMMAPWIPCSSLIEDELEQSKAYFNNFVLGVPYIGADVTVNRDVILRNLKDGKPDVSDTFFGVDVGGRVHVVIGNNEGIFKVCATDWDGLKALINLYQPRQIVIDALPETTMSKKVRDWLPHRVKLCYYVPPTPREPGTQEPYVVDYEEQTISAKRTEVIDRVISEFTSGKIRVQMDANEPNLVGGSGVRKGESYCEHWESLYLMHDEDKDVQTWEHSGPDHYAHATVYFWLARQVAGSKEKHKARVQ